MLNANEENTLNILNDFAVIQNTNVVSSDLGQTISQEVSKELPYGEEIMFLNDKILIKPCVNENVIKVHKLFLKKRIDDAILKSDVKIEPLQSRLKSFTSERLNIYIPDILTKNKKILRELDYILKFMSNLNKNFAQVIIDDHKFYIPNDYIKIANEKLKSLKVNLKNLQVIVY